MPRPSEVRDGLYISDGLTARRYGDEFDHVITLSRDGGPDIGVGSHEHTTQYFPLYDGPRTTQDDFEAAVGATVKAIDQHDGDVLVHCQAGVSRSATVLITALSLIDDITYDEAYSIVSDAKYIQPNPELRELALEMLDEDPRPYKEPFEE